MIRSRFILITLTVVGVAVAPAAFRGSSVSSPRIGTVTSASPMLEPRSGHTATLLPDGKILITGGMRRNQDFYRSAELYNPATGKFQSTGEMNERRVGQAAVLLRSGKVLIVGGWVGPGCTDSAELYDPATGRFKAIGKMVTRRAHPSATLLPDGNVLVAGGSDHDGRDASLASAEIFDAATLSFRPTGSMSHPRVSHSATLLHDGRVLMVGGVTRLTPSPRSTIRRRSASLRLAAWSRRATSTPPACFPMAACWWRAATTNVTGAGT